MVVPSLRGGGLERVVRDLSIALWQRGHHPEVFCLNGLGVYATDLHRAGIAVHDCRDRPIRIRGLPLRLIVALRRFKPEVIHAHSGTWFPAAVAKTFLRTPRLIFTDHGRYPDGPSGKRLTERWCFTRTDRITAVSASLAEYLREYLTLHDSPTVVHNGIDLDLYRGSSNGVRNKLRADWHLSDEDCLLVAVGRLVPIKNHAALLEAFALAAPRAPNLRLTILGDGRLEEHLIKRARRLNIDQTVTFLGYRSDVPACLQAADGFVIASSTEGLPISLLEAMAAGLPIISSNVGGIPEALGEPPAGVLYPSADLDRLADAMVTLASDDDRRKRLRHLAFRRAVSFSIDNMTDQYCGVYRRLNGAVP
jgi:glycosyltransferase involved in cell wall biosynthesis